MFGKVTSNCRCGRSCSCRFVLFLADYELRLYECNSFIVHRYFILLFLYDMVLTIGQVFHVGSDLFTLCLCNFEAENDRHFSGGTACACDASILGHYFVFGVFFCVSLLSANACYLNMITFLTL